MDCFAALAMTANGNDGFAELDIATTAQHQAANPPCAATETSIEDRRPQPRALSQDADLSRPPADHPWRLDHARGILRRLRQCARAVLDVHLDARPRRHPYRCFQAF